MPIKIPNELPAVKTLTQENIFVITETRPVRILFVTKRGTSTVLGAK